MLLIGVVLKPFCGSRRDQRINPSSTWVVVNKSGLDEQGARQSDQSSQRPKNPTPQKQRNKGHRRRQTHGIASKLWLDNRLDDEVQHRVGDDNSHRRHPAVFEESQEGWRDNTDDEANIWNVVRQEAEQRPDPGKRNADDEQRCPVKELSLIHI